MKKNIVTGLCTWIMISGLYAQDSIFISEPQYPPPTDNAVNDFSEILSPEDEVALENTIRDYFKKTSNQIVIMAVPVDWPGDVPVEDYAHQLATDWKLGSEKNDNGLLILLVGTADDVDGRALRFEVGRGLEGALPDALCAEIQRNEMVPYLLSANYAESFNRGVTAVIQAIGNEYQEQGEAAHVQVPLFADYAGMLTPQEEEGLKAVMEKLNKRNILLPALRYCLITGAHNLTPGPHDVLINIDRSRSVRVEANAISYSAFSAPYIGMLDSVFLEKQIREGNVEAITWLVQEVKTKVKKETALFRYYLFLHPIVYGLYLMLFIMLFKRSHIRFRGKKVLKKTFFSRGIPMIALTLLTIVTMIIAIAAMGGLPILFAEGYPLWLTVPLVAFDVVVGFLCFGWSGYGLLGWKVSSGGSSTYSGSGSTTTSSSSFSSYSGGGGGGGGYSGGGGSFGGGGATTRW